MGLIDRSVAEREIGTAVPISIATALAIESLCGVHPDIVVDRAPALDYGRVMINLRTLVRNVHGALETEMKKLVTSKQIVTAIIEEMTIIESSVLRASNGTCVVTYYLCSLDSLRRDFPYAFLKVPNTELQRMYVDLERESLKELLKRVGAHDVRLYDVNIRDSFTDVTAMVTHLPIDLLSKGRFRELVLLESHTGAFKKQQQWHTKLTGGKDLDRIPFNRLMLQIFGDNGQLFSPMPRVTKEKVLEVAEKRKWTIATTIDKILADISAQPDQVFRSDIKLLME
jgi:hypothetical protein